MLIPFQEDIPWNNPQSIIISHPLNTILNNMTAVKRQSTSLAAILVDRGTGGAGGTGSHSKMISPNNETGRVGGPPRLKWVPPSAPITFPLTHLFSFMLPCLSTLVADNADLSAGEAIPNQSFDGLGPSWVANGVQGQSWQNLMFGDFVFAFTLLKWTVCAWWHYEM